MPERTE